MSLLLSWLASWLVPAQKARAEDFAEVGPGEVGLCFGGHSTVLIRYAELAIACDPILGRRLGVVRRSVKPGLSPSDLADADLVLITRKERDHLHQPTLRRLSPSATIIVPPSCARPVAALGFNHVIELGAGAVTNHRGIEIEATTCAPTKKNGAQISSYLIRGNGPSLFYCADGAYFAGFAAIGKRAAPDIAVLPIGGYVPGALREQHMSPLDALYAFEDLGARMLIPIRHSAFALSYETMDEPLDWLRELVGERRLEKYVLILPVGAARKFRRAS